MLNLKLAISEMNLARQVMVFLVLMALSNLGWGADRIPVPSAAELKQLQASVKDVFKADIAAAKSGAQQSTLAERMIENVQNDAASVGSDYALLTQAHAIAVKASARQRVRDTSKLLSEISCRRRSPAPADTSADCRDGGYRPGGWTGLR